jgi:hypothetical protein
MTITTPEDMVRGLDKWLGKLGEDERGLLSDLDLVDTVRADLEREGLDESVGYLAGRLEIIRRWTQSKAAPPPPAMPPSYPDGLLVPTDGVYLAEIDSRRAVIHFPAELEWLAARRPVYDWPGWNLLVGYDAPACLEEFVTISDAEGALTFARTYGPLWACRAHAPVCLWKGIDGPDMHGVEHVWNPVELVDTWLLAASTLRAVLTAAARMRAEEPLQQDELDGLLPHTDHLFAGRDGDARTELERAILQSVVGQNLRKHGVHLALDYALHVEIRPALGVLPAMWKQALAAIGGAKELAVCSACTRPYLRRGRATKIGQRNFCPECDKSGERKRMSARDKSADSARADG